MRIIPENFRIYGDRIYLRPITIADTKMVLSWRNSPYVVNNFFYRLPISEEEHSDWIENKVNKGLVYQFVVHLKDTDEEIGCVYLQHYEAFDNSMESGVFMSEKAPKGKGLATEAVKLMNDCVAFEMLGLSRTVAKVIATNIGSLRLHEKAGFEEISREKAKIIPTEECVECVTLFCPNRRSFNFENGLFD